MTITHRLQLEMLRLTATQEIQTLNLDSPVQCRFAAGLMLVVMHIDEMLREKSAAPDPCRRAVSKPNGHIE
jgi:hypothetical protein